MPLHIEPSHLDGAFVIGLLVAEDERGYFQESFVASKYRAIGIHDDFVQDNLVFSRAHVLRGLHSDPRMGKLVHVVNGSVFDVIVDARKDSRTFGQWQGVELSGTNHRQLYIPPGFLHGYLVTSDDAIFCYKQSAEYDPREEVSVRWDDPTIGVRWPLTGTPIVSTKDQNAPSFRERYAAA